MANVNEWNKRDRIRSTHMLMESPLELENWSNELVSVYGTTTVHKWINPIHKNS